jgi:5-methylcytosine-specific restriction protein A
MRNPKWHRDEIILALDLYFSPNRGPIDKNNPRIIELSHLLNSLPLFIDKPDEEKFRNPNGVTFKLSNFLTFDASYKGKGMAHGSKLDEKLFNEYLDKKNLLRSTTREIKAILKDETLRQKVNTIENDEQTIEDSVMEGQIIYKLHKLRERDVKIVKRKKEQALAANGKLICETCTFSFEAFYGELGAGFIECHHRIPLSKLTVEKKTTLDDLALVCSNCHRMLHRRIDTNSIEDLKMTIKYSYFS